MSQERVNREQMSREEMDQFLAETRIGVLATADRDGRPEGTPVWFEYRDGIVRMLVHEKSRKARNVRVNPAVSLTIDTREKPFKGVVLRGQAEVRPAPPGLRGDLARRYLGPQAGDRYLARTVDLEQTDVMIRIKVRSGFGWDYSKSAN